MLKLELYVAQHAYYTQHNTLIKLHETQHANYLKRNTPIACDVAHNCLRRNTLISSVAQHTNYLTRGVTYYLPVV